MLRSYAGGSIFGASTGESPARVVALHGWGRTHRDFDRVLAPSGATPFAAIALDLPGFGATPAPTEPWTSRDFADAIVPVLEEIGEPVVLVGHSHGGRVAVALADMVPNRVAGLVLVGAPVLRPATRRPSLGYRLLRSLYRRGLYSEARMEALRQRRGSADYRAATGVLRDTLVTVVNEDFTSELQRLTVPTVLVWGADDVDVPPQVAEQAAALLAQNEAGVNAKVVVLDGVGHLVPTQAPAELRTAIEELL